MEDNHNQAGPSSRPRVYKRNGSRLQRMEGEEDAAQDQNEDHQFDGEGHEEAPEVNHHEDSSEDDQNAHEGPVHTRDLKLKMPEFKGKKGRDPQVHISAFESWAKVRELPRGEWRTCFPQTLKGLAQKWYFNYPPEALGTFKSLSKAFVQRFKDEKTDEELLSQLGRIKQKRTRVRQFVEEIKDLARQLSSPAGRKSMRAWFLNGTSIRGLAEAEITNPTRTFEELIQRALRMERKAAVKDSSESQNSSSTSSDSDSSDDGKVKTKSRVLDKHLKKMQQQIEELTGKRTHMPKKGEVWCVHCRVTDHPTSACIKCDYCERRGHRWEDCPIRMGVPAVQLAAPQTTQNQDGSGPAFRQNYNRPPRKIICWGCSKEGHFARDCPDRNNGAQQQSNVNWVHPEVSAITRAHAKDMLETPIESNKPSLKWQELKSQAIQVTQALKKRKPVWQEGGSPTLHDTAASEEPSKRSKTWVWAVKKAPEEAPMRHQDTLNKSPESSQTEVVQGTDKPQQPEKIKTIPAVEPGWEQQTLAYELNKAGIRDDQAPTIEVKCKVRKHWKMVEQVTLDGGAGVNIMSEELRKRMELPMTAAPFKLRMADQKVTEPLGLVEDVPVKVAGMKFKIAFLILDVGKSYEMLLGRPWLRAAGAVHNWCTDELTMKVGKVQVTISTRSTTLQTADRPGGVFLAEPHDLGKKLKLAGIIPLATMDLN